MNFLEKWVLKRIAKKLVKNLPDLREKAKNEGKQIFDKYIQQIEQHGEELFDKIQIAIVQFVEKCEDNCK